ncbi:MAG TPA: fumarylacetoacetate hydrolase family protein [Actinopolymorphaceae bacterium]
MDATTIAALGREIYEAERAAAPVQPLSARHPELDPAAAYAVQEAYARLRVASGARLIGRKIGCTSAAIQTLFGIDTPDYGQLFDDMLIADGGEVSSDALVAPMVEPELTFLLHADLVGPGVTVDDVLAATRSVLPSLEVIDSRIEEWRIQFVDTVADNGSSARCVFGQAIPIDELEARGIDLATERVRLYCDGTELFTGTGSDVLGHPCAAVAWLANALAAYGRRLRAGDFVMSGSMTSAAPARRGQTYEARFANFGTVSCRFG